MYGKPAHNRGIKRPGVGGRKKGRVWSEEERAMQLELRSQDGYYDYLKDPARGKKISKARQGIAGTTTGRKWFNNGVEQLLRTSCPEGYTAGRLKQKTNNKKGLLWFNNTKENKQFKVGEEPEGFVRGRIIKKQ